MTLSLPSREVYSLDTPEIKKFSCEFKYNYFSTDESTNDLGLISESELQRSPEQSDAGVQLSLARIPRFVEFTFTLSRIIDVNRDVDIKSNKNVVRPPFLISQNLDKIISEDQFSSNTFMSLNFSDGDVEGKIYKLLSGTIEQFAFDGSLNANKLAKQLSGKYTNDDIDTQFISSFFGSIEQNTSTKFYTSREGTGRSKNLSIDSKHDIKGLSSGRGDKVKLTSTFNERLHNVHSNVQINGKFIYDLLASQLNDPMSQIANNLPAIIDNTKKMQDSSRQQNLLPTDDDYQAVLPFIDITVQNTSHYDQRSSTELVGFIIDKFEISNSGQLIQHDPIIIENANVARAYDSKVKYGTRYKYQIRAIMLFTLPAIDSDTGDIATLKSLVSSKPTHPVYIMCEEDQAPPCPNDLNFTWNYETDKLMVHWNLPVNPQRDIKHFQVFRRKSIEEPFELMVQHDFNDSLIKIESNERPDGKLIMKLPSPMTFWIDDEFKRNSSYIYSVVSIDAHGLSSGYSAQFKVGFDIFKNKITKTIVSHSGAPKPYPNLYVENQLFVNTMRPSGASQVKIVFNPEMYSLTDDDGKLIKVLTTKQDGGRYTMNILNLDNQKSDTVSIVIDDQINISSINLKSSKLQLGQTKREKN